MGMVGRGPWRRAAPAMVSVRGWVEGGEATSPCMAWGGGRGNRGTRRRLELTVHPAPSMEAGLTGTEC